MRISRRWLRAALSMAALWGLAGAAALLFVLIRALLAGKKIGGAGALLLPFAFASGITFGAGLAFAISISVVGRLRRERFISPWSGAAWGGCAGAAISAAILLNLPGSVEPVSAMGAMATWIGIGGVFGAAIIGVATRTHRSGRLGARRPEVSPGAFDIAGVERDISADSLPTREPIARTH